MCLISDLAYPLYPVCIATFHLSSRWRYHGSSLQKQSGWLNHKPSRQRGKTWSLSFSVCRSWTQGYINRGHPSHTALLHPFYPTFKCLAKLKCKWNSCVTFVDKSVPWDMGQFVGGPPTARAVLNGGCYAQPLFSCTPCPMASTTKSDQRWRKRNRVRVFRHQDILNKKNVANLIKICTHHSLHIYQCIVQFQVPTMLISVGCLINFDFYTSICRLRT